MTEAPDLEALGVAINRVSGVLLAVGELYSPHEDAFSGGNAFAAHAVTTAHGLLVEASHALGALYARLLERAELEAQLTADRAVLEEELANERAQSNSSSVSYAQAQVAHAEQPDGAAPVWQNSIGNTERPAAEAESAFADNGFAQTYQELLQRVTAVEVFANDRDMQAMPEARKKLLPLVEDLRDELNKLSRVA